MHEPKDVKEIKVTYKDGSEKIVTRGVCFSVYEEGDSVHVSCDGIARTKMDEIAVLAIVARIAKEMGIDETLYDKAEAVEQEGGAVP